MSKLTNFDRAAIAEVMENSFETLVKHRFASHVCQTLFSVAAETVAREVCSACLFLYFTPNVQCISLDHGYRSASFRGSL